jgi:uncharacterized protein (DUF58 family)
LIVCELQSNARPVVQLVLDADPRVHSGLGPDGSREWSVRVAASLAKGWLQAGARVGAVWNGQAIPASSGQAQLRRLLDGLARLPDAPGPSLAEALASPACRAFADGIQVIVTTDVALVRGPPDRPARDRRRWVVLRAGAFGDDPRDPAEPAANNPVHPWLWVDSPDKIPALLRGQWKEARHGP